MPKKVRSAKGEIVDFNLLAIKQQMASTPAPTNVEAREEFVDRKLRRRKAKRKATVNDANINKSESKVDDVAIEQEDKHETAKEEYEKSVEDSKEKKDDATTTPTKRIKKTPTSEA